MSEIAEFKNMLIEQNKDIILLRTNINNFVKHVRQSKKSMDLLTSNLIVKVDALMSRVNHLCEQLDNGIISKIETQNNTLITSMLSLEKAISTSNTVSQERIKWEKERLDRQTKFWEKVGKWITPLVTSGGIVYLLLDKILS